MESGLRLLLQSVARYAPLVLSCLLVLLIGILDLSAPAPLPPVLVAWGCIYYWALFQPALLGYGAVAVIGLLQDMVYGFPLGVSILTLLLCRFVAMRLKRLMTSRVFFITWGGFGAMMLLAVVSMTLALGYATTDFSGAVLVQMLSAGAITWLAYPLMHGVCNLAYSLIPHLQLRGQSL